MSSHVNDGQLQKYGALLSRLVLGAILLAHGILKLLDVPATLAYFASLGLAPELAYLVAALEIGGGVLLVLGIQTRWAALVVLPGLLGATWVHLANGWLFSSRGGGWEYPLLLALLAIGQVLSGNNTFTLPGRLWFSWHDPETIA
jgi:putative oxidoreductase